MSTVPVSPSAAGDGRARLVGLLILAVAAFVALATELAPVGLLPNLGRAFHQSVATTGILVTVYAVMVMVFAVPLTLVMRRISGKRMLIIALAGYALCNLLSALAPNFGVLIAARCVGGIAHAIFFSACIGQVARLATPGRTARAFAIVTAGISAGYVLGSPLTTALGNAGGWQLPFAVLVGATLVVLLLLVWLLPNSTPEQDVTPARPGISIRGAGGIVTANGLAYFGQYAIYTYVTVLLLHAHLPQSLVAVTLLVFGLVGLITIWGTASLLDHRPRATSVVVLVLVAASIFAVGAASSSLVPLLVFGAVWGAAYGPVAALFQGAAVRSGAVDPEMAGAWINATSNVGIAAGALLGGIVLDHSNLQVLAWAAAVPVAAAAIVLAVVMRRRSADSV
ncbi:MAG TPA: MFS transporter [Galbitalea sp.]|jgi:predicted MFS family arabinose efflux permease